MTFENFSRLTSAKLINTPSISGFENIEINPKKIKRGDLFIGNNKADIELALHLEAYGVVTETPYTVLDEEIAWFQADSLEEVLIRLLRFRLLEHIFYFIYADDVTLQLLEKIADKKSLYILRDDEKENFKTIINAEKNSFIFSSDKNFLEKIYPNFEILKVEKNKRFENVAHTLFLTHFTYSEKKYKNIKIPLLFLTRLEQLVLFLEEKSISFEIEKLNFTSHLYPIFVDKSLGIKPFGKSDKVLICESDMTLVEEDINYLKNETPWAKHLLLIPENLRAKIDKDIKIITYKNLEDFNQLKNIDFNFAIIVIDYKKLINKLEKKAKKEQTLFFQGE